MDFIVHYSKGENMFKGWILGMLTFLAFITVNGCSLLTNGNDTAYKDLPNHSHIKCTGDCDVKIK